MSSKLQYLLDTNIISELVRNPHGNVKERIAQVGENLYVMAATRESEMKAFARQGRENRQSAKTVESRCERMDETGSWWG